MTGEKNPFMRVPPPDAEAEKNIIANQAGRFLQNKGQLRFSRLKSGRDELKVRDLLSRLLSMNVDVIKIGEGNSGSVFSVRGKRGNAIPARNWQAFRSKLQHPVYKEMPESRVDHEIVVKIQSYKMTTMEKERGGRMNRDVALWRKKVYAEALIHKNAIAEGCNMNRHKGNAVLACLPGVCDNRLLPTFFFAGMLLKGGLMITVMERVRGQSMKSYVRVNGVSPSLVVRVEAALLTLWVGYGMCHGDLHDDNIIITPEGSIRFIDFGLSIKLPERYQKKLRASMTNGEIPSAIELFKNILVRYTNRVVVGRKDFEYYNSDHYLLAYLIKELTPEQREQYKQLRKAVLHCTDATTQYKNRLRSAPLLGGVNLKYARGRANTRPLIEKEKAVASSFGRNAVRSAAKRSSKKPSVTRLMNMFTVRPIKMGSVRGWQVRKRPRKAKGPRSLLKTYERRSSPSPGRRWSPSPEQTPAGLYKNNIYNNIKSNINNNVNSRQRYPISTNGYSPGRLFTPPSVVNRPAPAAAATAASGVNSTRTQRSLSAPSSLTGASRVKNGSPSRSTGVRTTSGRNAAAGPSTGASRQNS